MLAVVAIVVGGAIGLAMRGDGTDKASSSLKSAGKSTTKKPASSGADAGASGTSAAPAAPQPQASTSKAQGSASGGDPVALNNQGFARINAGDYAGAVAPLRSSVQAFRDAGRTDELDYYFALYNLGVALNRSGNPAEAIPFLQERLRNPNQQGTVKKELQSAQAKLGGTKAKDGKGDKGGD